MYDDYALNADEPIVYKRSAGWVSYEGVWTPQKAGAFCRHPVARTRPRRLHQLLPPLAPGPPHRCVTQIRLALRGPHGDAQEPQPYGEKVREGCAWQVGWRAPSARAQPGLQLRNPPASSLRRRAARAVHLQPAHLWAQGLHTAGQVGAGGSGEAGGGARQARRARGPVSALVKAAGGGRATHAACAPCRRRASAILANGRMDVGSTQLTAGESPG